LEKKVASSRSFGLLFFAFFVIVGITNYWTGGHWYIFWAAFAVGVLTISLLMPRLLAPLKKAWLKIGRALNFVVSPLVLGLVYVLAIIPVRSLIWLFGKDLLSLKHNPSARTYWISRDLGGPAPESLRDQF
jgi:Saxitoxin biosynthesis operon protein SxtJ